MRELERNAADTSHETPARAGVGAVGAEAARPRIAVVGRGRVGTALAAGLRRAGYAVDGPAGRGEAIAGAPAGPDSARHAPAGAPGGPDSARRAPDAVLLCVPDAEIEAAAAAVAGVAPLTGHTSGATPLTALEPAGGDRFGLHPLQTIVGPRTDLRGSGCAVAGSSPAAVALAGELAEALGMHPFELRDSQRAAYHAAASIASNFLLTLEAAAESVAAGAGIGAEDARRLLGPLVRTTVESWLATGPEEALTGPVARGDEATVAAQREAVARSAPQELELFDLLVERTRALARTGEAAPA